MGLGLLVVLEHRLVMADKIRLTVGHVDRHLSQLRQWVPFLE
jgi:hypothetical protein